ncbi:MAG: sugar phosphate isomerase/epimerase family protein, partial [Candidatus Poribacteria bacterium]
MKLAIVTSIRQTVAETILYLDENGLEAIECGYQHFIDSNNQSLRELRKGFADSGKRIWSVHAPFGKGSNLSAIDDEERAKALEMDQKLLQKVGMAGVEALVIHPGVAEDNEENLRTMSSLIVESLSELVVAAEQEGVKLALENMLPKHPGSDGEELLNMVKQIDSPWLGVCFDSGHAHVAGDMRKHFETLKDSIITFHIQDNDSTRDMHLQPGYGTTNWRDFADVLNTMNFTDPIVIEAAPWGGAGAKWMLKEVTALLENA